MSVFRVIGDHVVKESEYRQKAVEVAGASQAPGSVEFSGGRTLSLDAAPEVGARHDIGLGLPLTITITEVYTGRYPQKGLLGGHPRKDVAVVSGVKNFDVFNASARALNFIQPQIGSHGRIKAPSALSQGTSLVAYSPAVLSDSQVVTVEFAVDNFPQELFDKVSGAFTALSGVPILLPYAGFLMGASGVAKLAGSLGEALFDGHPAFSVTESIDFATPGLPIAKADFRILAGSALAADQYRYDPEHGLVDASGAVYDGDEPYVVLNLDGRENKQLEGFAPSVASAAVLQRFFSVKDGGEASINAVTEGLHLFSDLQYRDRALKLKAQIDAGTGDTGALQSSYDAILKNISSDVIRPR